MSHNGQKPLKNSLKAQCVTYSFGPGTQEGTTHRSLQNWGQPNPEPRPSKGKLLVHDFRGLGRIRLRNRKALERRVTRELGHAWTSNNSQNNRPYIIQAIFSVLGHWVIAWRLLCSSFWVMTCFPMRDYNILPKK